MCADTIGNVCKWIKISVLKGGPGRWFSFITQLPN